MFKPRLHTTIALFAGLVAFAAAAAELPLADSQLKAKYKARMVSENGVIKLATDSPEWDSGLEVLPPEGQKFDFSNARYLALEVKNLSDSKQMRLTMHLSSGSKDDKNRRECYTGIGLNPGETRTMRLYLPHESIFKVENGRSRKTIDTAKVNGIEFKLLWPFEAGFKNILDVELSNLRLEGEPETGLKVPADKYLPFIDAYGQYVHSDWPEKIKSDEDLLKARAKEQAVLAQTAPVADWNRFGGWTGGPQLKATGSFRVEKYQNMWFLVDPEGRLFWSNGIDVLKCQTDATPNTHPDWFADPRTENNVHPFNDWNLRKKYGKDDYQGEFYQTLIRRLNAWGINTIGNWADRDLMLLGQIPYTMQLTDFNGKIAKFKDSKFKFYDVFDPEFEAVIGNILKSRIETDPATAKSVNDPMCIGYFIDNELKFDQIVPETIRANPDQFAKVELIKDLKAKYQTIEALNKSWESEFKSWEDLAENRKGAKGPGYKEDTRAFLGKFVSRYFKVCRDGIKKVAPHRLYLGSRFVSFRQAGPVWEAAAKYCDIVSVNSYCNSIANVNRGDFRDKPIIVGEFHFGTYDRGMFSPSLSPVADQNERAVAYTRYIQGALVNPNIVGAHYFQFRDQPLTGRWDGEGYQIGFVDVADTPYDELAAAARKIGENMYNYRLQRKLNNQMNQ